MTQEQELELMAAALTALHAKEKYTHLLHKNEFCATVAQRAQWRVELDMAARDSTNAEQAYLTLRDEYIR